MSSYKKNGSKQGGVTIIQIKSNFLSFSTYFQGAIQDIEGILGTTIQNADEAEDKEKEKE